ncbi:MAG: hypothetical protein HWE34_16500, partial [Methylocystaceae bacterium]|nr:hypothetical protein [Methylocystaceae bacterium]
NDTIDGGAGSDTIYGGGGDDTIYATLDGVSDSFYGDNSTYDASSGTDTLSYVNQTGSTPLSSVIFTGSGTGAVVDGGSSDSFSQIENFVGSTYDDSLDLSGGVMSTIDGGSGADTFNLNNGAVTSIAGGEGDDTFNLNSNALSIDQISGDAGDDTFNITDLNILGSTILDGGSESSGDTVAFVNATASGPLALGNNMLNFETYDITGASGVHNNLTIDQLGVAENGASTVTIIGDAGDAVLFAANDSWVAGANDGTYTSYTSTYSAGTTIKVDNDITVGTF